MRVVFMGTPDFSVPVLNSLIHHDFEVVLVVTQPDKQVGRGRKFQHTPVKKVAIENNIEVLQPENINSEVNTICNVQPDLIITCAYGQILSSEVLSCARIKAVNVHASLLPAHRGGAPIHRAILNGDEYSGVSIMEMVEKMDAGNVFLQDKVQIEASDTFASMHNKLSILGSRLLIEAIPLIVSGESGTIQDESKVTYSPNIAKFERVIDFNDLAYNIFNKVRAFNTFPSAYGVLNDNNIQVYEVKVTDTKSNVSAGTIVNISKSGIEVACSDFNIIITKLKLPGKKLLNASEFYNGNNSIKENMKFD